MPKQTFATREFFVNACEATARQTILNLPLFFNRLQLLAENLKLHCITFLYSPDTAQSPLHLVISVLPLNEGCTKITMHGSYTTGCAFTKDPYVTNAVANVEAALQAAINGCTTPFEPAAPKKNLSQRCQHAKHASATLLSNAFKGRKFLKPSHY